MTFQPNTTLDVLRGTATTPMGDEIETTDGPAHLSNLPASLIERTRRVFMPESGEVRTVRYGIARLKPGTDVKNTDTLRDRTTGRLWEVNEISGGERTLAGRSDLVLDLRSA